MATVGGWEDVDINKISVDVNCLARFAIDEHNKKEHANLQFVKLDGVRLQPVAEGRRYDITLEATDDGVQKVYKAIVLVKPGDDPPELEEFKLIGDAPAKARA